MDGLTGKTLPPHFSDVRTCQACGHDEERGLNDAQQSYFSHFCRSLCAQMCYTMNAFQERLYESVHCYTPVDKDRLFTLPLSVGQPLTLFPSDAVQ